MEKQLNIKYSLIQGLYWTIYCTILGYSTVYLLSHGLDNSTIGVILALANILTTVIQPGLASYIDKMNLSLRRVVITIFGSIVVLAILMMLLSQVSILLRILFVFITTLLMCTVPLLNSLTFAFEERGYVINFGLARGIGSAAYAITSLLLGYMVEQYSPKLLPIIYMILIVGVIPLINSFKLPNGNGQSKKVVAKKEKIVEEQTSLIDFMKKYKKFVLLIVGVVFVFFDHILINNFAFQVITNIGGSSSDMGKAIFLAAMVELPIMACFNTLKDKISCGKIMIFSSIFFTLKHIVTYFATNILMIYIAQALQMFAYALFIPASVFYVSKLVHEKDLVKGQSLMTMAQTIAGVFASLCGGIMLDTLGVKSTLLIGAIISAIGTAIVFISSEKTI